MMRERNSRGGLALLLILSTASVHAEGFYVDVGAVGSLLETDGLVRQTRPNTLFPDDFGTESLTGWRVAVGYRGSQNFAFEVGHVDFGDVTLSPARDDLVQSGNSYSISYRDTRASLKGLYAAVLATWPRARWDVFAKLGTMFADTSATTNRIYRYRVSPVESNESSTLMDVSDDSIELLLGIGAAYRFTEHYGAALEAARADDLMSLTLSARYNF